MSGGLVSIEKRTCTAPMPVRGLVWLFALLAFVLPPAASAVANGGHMAMSDCADHSPPPDPCPDKGTAKHAAGLCCPLMASAVALMPASPDSGHSRGPFDSVSAGLSGLLFTEDRPPPRA